MPLISSKKELIAKRKSKRVSLKMMMMMELKTKSLKRRLVVLNVATIVSPLMKTMAPRKS